MRSIYVEQMEHAPSLIADIIEREYQDKGSLRIGIPGGRGAKVVIEALLSLDDSVVADTMLYLVDERLEGERNEPMLMAYGLSRAVKEQRFDLSHLIIPTLFMKLPEHFFFDLLFLGVGEDGHFASLFPDSYTGEHDEEALKEIEESPKPPNRRVTFTFSAFASYSRKRKVYLLCFGDGKREAYRRLMKGTEKPDTLPSLFFEQQGFDPVVMTDLADPGDTEGA